jgi:CBS domain-containing protein
VPKLVADVMHRGVITCPSGASAITAARIMAAHHIHAAPVVGKDGRCSSIVTDGAIVEALERGTIGTQMVDGVAAAAAIVGPLEPLGRAIGLMHERRTTHVVVVEPASKQPVGVLSALDLLEILAEGDAGDVPLLVG